LFISDDASDVFEDLVFECPFDEIFASFDSEHNMERDLGICICHVLPI